MSVAQKPVALTLSNNTAAPGRIESIDALRGFDMFWIVGGGPVVAEFLKLFVNPLPPWLSQQFDHVRWEGFSAWDLIMPLFMFVVGAAMPFSIGRRLERGDSRTSIYRKAIVRTVLLFILGMAVQGNLLAFDLKTLHLYCNTLQAIAAGYLISTIALVEFPIIAQVLFAFALLIGYWLLMVFVPTPGGTAGAMTEGGNLAIWIDIQVLGQFRANNSYTWVLTSLAFAGTVMFGVLAGQLLCSKLPQWQKVLFLAAVGLACLLGGWLWSYTFPFIKHLYTSSVVLWACGWSFLLLTVFYAVIDVLGMKRWTFPFIVIGMNAITAYLMTHLLNFNRIYGSVSKSLLGGIARQTGQFAEFIGQNWWTGFSARKEPLHNFVLNFGAFAVVWVILCYMHRNKTYLRI
jgi:predicted acyltransferase